MLGHARAERMDDVCARIFLQDGKYKTHTNSIAPLVPRDRRTSRFDAPFSPCGGGGASLLVPVKNNDDGKYETKPFRLLSAAYLLHERSIRLLIAPIKFSEAGKLRLLTRSETAHIRVNSLQILHQSPCARARVRLVY